MFALALFAYMGPPARAGTHSPRTVAVAYQQAAHPAPAVQAESAVAEGTRIVETTNFQPGVAGVLTPYNRQVRGRAPRAEDCTGSRALNRRGADETDSTNSGALQAANTGSTVRRI